MSTTKYRCVIPEVPGPDLLHPSLSSAEREAANARRQGYEATVEPVEVVVRVGWASLSNRAA